MTAAESFCGMEQTTARVEPVAIISDPGYGFEPTIREIRQRETEINHTHEVRWMLAQCRACVTGADAAAWVLKPRVLCPVTTVTYRRGTGLIIPYVSPN